MVVEISRLDLLKGLQTLQPDAPLKSGDEIGIGLSAKLKDGTPLAAEFKVRVVGQPGRDDKDRDHARDRD